MFKRLQINFYLKVIIHNLWLNETIKETIDAKRIHHQLIPMTVDYEEGLSQVFHFSCISVIETFCRYTNIDLSTSPYVIRVFIVLGYSTGPKDTWS